MTPNFDKLTSGWYNYRTGEYDFLTESPANYSDYLPQHTAAQALYRLYQDVGDTPADAAKKVLELIAGEVTP